MDHSGRVYFMVDLWSSQQDLYGMALAPAGDSPVTGLQSGSAPCTMDGCRQHGAKHHCCKIQSSLSQHSSKY